MSYLLAFLGFAALITLHEAGHFTAAKAVGMRVERFSLFFGPMFVKRRIGETEYGIGVIPLGGYVKITGMSPNETFDSPEIEARAYINQPPWKRIVVIAAGPAVNIVLAFLLALVYFLAIGQHNVLNKSWAARHHQSAWSGRALEQRRRACCRSVTRSCRLTASRVASSSFMTRSPSTRAPAGHR